MRPVWMASSCSSVGNARILARKSKLLSTDFVFGPSVFPLLLLLPRSTLVLKFACGRRQDLQGSQERSE